MASTDKSFSLETSDITKCSICLESFKEPKVLPCIHTYCLQCIAQYCENKNPDELSCPLCRHIFVIPPGGIQDLPTNFFMIQLQQVNALSDNSIKPESNKQHACGMCSVSESSLTSYCLECDENICNRCATIHNQLKALKSHHVMPRESIPSVEEISTLAISYCVQHPSEQIRFYCYDCKTVSCVVCFSNEHKKHDWTDVKESGEKFREQLNDDIVIVSACSYGKQENILKQLEIYKSSFLDKVTAAESAISDSCEQLISAIQSQRSQLMEKLNLCKVKILKKIENEKDEIERQFVMVDSFQRYCQEMKNKGNACDISRMSHDLHARVEDLVKNVAELNERELIEVEITFNHSAAVSDIVNCFGELIITDGDSDEKDTLLKQTKGQLSNFLAKSVVLHVMPSYGTYITGITTLGSDVFVVRGGSQVYVYNNNNFALTREFVIPCSKNLHSVVASSMNKCLYISDSQQPILYRYDLSNNLTTHLSLKGICLKLSLTKSHNVVISLNTKRMLCEYSDDGHLLRQIQLNCFKEITHCLSLLNDRFLVGGIGSEHHVCIVNSNGDIIQTYMGTQKSGDLHFDPRHMVVDMHNNILVADRNNNKIRLLSSSLSYLGDEVIIGYQLKHPNFLHFDELNNRLYIGESTGGRLFFLMTD